MQSDISYDSLAFHYLICPSRKIKRQLSQCFGLLGIGFVAVYGLVNYHLTIGVDSNVEPDLISKSPGSHSDTLSSDLSASNNQKESEIARLRSALKLAEEEIKQLALLNENQHDLNDELNQTVNQFKTGAVYLNNKYGDFAYAFNLKDAEVVPLSRGIHGGKVLLAALQSMSQQIPFGTVFERPYRISSRFGARNIKNHPGASKNHKGIDFPVSEGTPIYAPADGFIEIVRPSNSRKGSGNFIRIEHGFGFESSYSHLSKFTVTVGELVQKGDLIGYSGNTGYTTGPHLHYEIKYRGRHIDPEPLYSYKAGTDIAALRSSSSVDWDRLVSIYTDNVLSTAVILRP